MTKDEMMTMVSLMESAYPGKEFLTNKTAFDCWYEEFQSEDYDDVRTAFKNHMRTGKFLPCIADITAQLDKIKHDRNQTNSVIESFYDNASNSYPGRGNDETKDLFFRLAYSCEGKDPTKVAQYMARVISENPTDKPLIEFMRENFR